MESNVIKNSADIFHQPTIVIYTRDVYVARIKITYPTVLWDWRKREKKCHKRIYEYKYRRITSSSYRVPNVASVFFNLRIPTIKLIVKLLQSPIDRDYITVNTKKKKSNHFYEKIYYEGALKFLCVINERLIYANFRVNVGGGAHLLCEKIG